MRKIFIRLSAACAAHIAPQRLTKPLYGYWLCRGPFDRFHVRQGLKVAQPTVTKISVRACHTCWFFWR